MGVPHPSRRRFAPPQDDAIPRHSNRPRHPEERASASVSKDEERASAHVSKDEEHASAHVSTDQERPASATPRPGRPALAALLRLAPPPARVLPLGVAALDRALPEGGLALGRLHEIVAGPGEAGTGFAAALLARIAGAAGRVLWCAPDGRGPALYGPGLAAFGLDPDRTIFVRAASTPDVLWAMEEGLRCRALAAVLGEVEAMDLTASRRLQLAAERHGVTALALRRQRRAARLEPSAATTRWQAAALPAVAGAAPEDALGDPAGDAMGETARWAVSLLRCRGGAPRDFVVEWSHGQGGFAARDRVVPAAAGDGPDPTPAAPQCDAAD